MAVIKYQINGKADTKPIKNTEAAAQGMFKKIEAIDNKLKAFAGVKVFQEVGKAVKNALTEYDKFQASLNGESNLTKQFDRVKTAMAGTLGTVRDELSNVIGDITGTDGFKALEEAIPKIGAMLIGGFKVASAIVVNIKDNFAKFLNPKIWEEFFTSAKNLGSSFTTFLSNALADAFKYSIEIFKWSFTDMNLPQLLWNGMSEFSAKFYELMGLLGKAISPAVKGFFDRQAESARAGKGYVAPPPGFRLSDETKNSFSGVVTNLGNTFKELLNTAAGTDVSQLYTTAYDEALQKLKITIAAMNDARTGDDLAAKLAALIAELKPLAKNAASEAGDKFSNATSRIESILGDATAEQAEKIRGKMEGLNKQFKTATERIEDLFDELENAKDAKAAENTFKKINDQIAKMNGLSDSMAKLDTTTQKTTESFDVLDGIFNLLGDAGKVLKAVFSGNVIGLIFELLGRFAGVFSNISGPFSAFLNIFDVFFDVVEEICAALEPALSVIFKPIVDIVRQLGIVFGMFLNILAPILGILGLLVNVIQIFSPILYGLAMVFAAVADGFATVYNVVSGVVKSLTFGAVNMGKMNTNNRDRLKDTWNAENYDEYKNSNNSTSYSVAGDMYININFSHSYVNGDFREIAIMLRNEIRLAEGAGY
jgi:phage shock protein A